MSSKLGAIQVGRSQKAKHPILIDDHYLRLYPDSNGIQKDERKSSRFPWKLGSRTVPSDAPLHSSVVKRSGAEAVVQYDYVKPYRPEPLRNHGVVKQYY